MQKAAFRYRLAKSDGVFAGFRDFDVVIDFAQKISEENQCYISVFDKSLLIKEFFRGVSSDPVQSKDPTP